MSSGETRKIAVGIDLGTTYSTASYINDLGRPVCVENGNGEVLTPSVVCIDSNSIVLGRDAIKASAFSPDSYFECFKREMGGDKSFSFQGLEVPPEVLSGLILDRLKTDVEKRIGSFRNAVITVPAYFDESRRQATVVAAELAGIDVLQIINEPTAAAVAYGFDLKSGDSKVVLVYDLGGGTFDVSILKIENGDFQTIATDGDVRLGGKDFDERLVDYLAEEFKKEHGFDPRQNNADLAQLWLDAEDTKRSLSEREVVPHVMYFQGLRHRIEISREKFDELTADLVGRSRTTVEMLMREANVGWNEIDELLLVGGSTRIPAVRQMLTAASGKSPNLSLNPDQVVSHGAAILCDSLMNKNVSKKLSLFNVSSHSLGVIGIHPKTFQKSNSIVIPRNTSLPFNATKRLITGKESQRSASIPVVEGESMRPEECMQIGECALRDLPLGLPKGTIINVHFSYDSGGRLAVSARIPKTRQSTAIVIERGRKLASGDLADWKQKLTGEASTGDSGHSSKLQRLDQLLMTIGREASTSNAADPVAAKRIATLHDDLRQKKKELTKLQNQQSLAESRSEAVQLSGKLARLSDEITSLELEANFAEIDMGRAFVQSSSEASRSSKPAQEARTLIAELS